MDNLAEDREDAPACSDEQVEDRRADFEVQHRSYDLERDAVDVDSRSVSISLSSDVPGLYRLAIA